MLPIGYSNAGPTKPQTEAERRAEFEKMWAQTPAGKQEAANKKESERIARQKANGVYGAGRRSRKQRKSRKPSRKSKSSKRRR